jgi:hypothetical protein
LAEAKNGTVTVPLRERIVFATENVFLSMSVTFLHESVTPRGPEGRAAAETSRLFRPVARRFGGVVRPAGEEDQPLAASIWRAMTMR